MALSNKQKRHLSRQANRWLKFKLKVESPFKRELKSYFFRQSKIIARGGEVETIAPVLAKHYKRIVREMTGIKLKQEDDDDYGLENSLILLLFGRAATQSTFIDKTTRQKLKLATELARESLREDGILFPTKDVLDRITANIFRSLNRGRVGGIAVYETQSLTEKIHDTNQGIANDMMNDSIINNDIELARRAAELSESMTMENIVDDIGKIPAGELFTVLGLMEKTWVTMGDSKVRLWHQQANWQTVPVDDPYIVHSELLMYPGDSSLGASLENTSGCRCHSGFL
jgi:hypothetical protein